MATFWSRSLDNLALFASIVERMLVFSNADLSGEPLLVAEKIDGQIEIHDEAALPEVTARLRKLE
jgi:predicted ABC-type ATPase